MRGDSADSVVSTGQGWVGQGQVVDAGVTYNSFVIAGVNALLNIEDTLSTVGVIT